MMKLSCFALHGQSIGSAVPLNELTESSRAPTLMLVEVESLDNLKGEYSVRLPRPAHGFGVRGREILVESSAAMGTLWSRNLFYSVVVPGLLRRQGRIVVRGSAVLVNGSALLIVGGAGAGKSTAAALLIARGAKLISDGALVIQTDPLGRPEVNWGEPLLRLSPEIRDAVQLPACDLGALREGIKKHALHLDSCSNTEAVPIGKICFLESAGSNSASWQLMQTHECLEALNRMLWAVSPNAAPAHDARAFFSGMCALARVPRGGRYFRPRSDGLDPSMADILIEGML